MDRSKSYRPLAAGLAGLLLVCGPSKLNAEFDREKFESFYQRLDSDCGNSFFTINADFEANFPGSDQADVLAEVIERAARQTKDVAILCGAIYFVDNFVRRDGSRPWGQRLEGALLEQAHHPDVAVRSSLACFLIHHEASHQRELILSFLDDADDQIRQRVIDEIYRSKWPDAIAIDKRYIARIQPEGSHHGSVVHAKIYTNPADNERAGRIVSMSEQSNAQTYYLAYVAKHRNDPDYEVSVDAAKRFYESNEANISYRKSVEQEEKREEFLHRNVPLEEKGEHTRQRPLTEQADFMFWIFNTKDSSTSQYACRYFNLVTVPAERPSLLTAIAKRAVQEPVNSDVFANVLVVAEHQHNNSPQVGVRADELDALAWSQRINPDRNVRNYIIRYFDGWQPEGWRDRILSFLNDPDSVVRETCVYAISNTWPDYEAIFTRYIADHSSKPGCEGTVYIMESVIKDRKRMTADHARSD